MVKCADCGFLAARNRETRELVEVERNENGEVSNPTMSEVKGIIDSGLSQWVTKYEDSVCFARACNSQSQYRLEPI